MTSRPTVSASGDLMTAGDSLDDLAALLSSELPERDRIRAVAMAALGAPALRPVREALADGDPDGALALALASVGAEPGASRRDAGRLACALAFRAAGETAVAAPLFSRDAHWTPDVPTAAMAMAAFSIVGGGWSQWQAEGLEQVALQAPARLAHAALRERFAIARRTGMRGDDLRRLFGLFARLDPAPPRLARSMAGLLWLFDGPSLIRPLFAACPPLARTAADDPLVAGLLWRGAWHATRRGERRAVRAAAAKLEAIERETQAFWKRLADPGVRVAVVGNSPCETGRGRGADIDAHDVVIRFNRAPEDGRFAGDYGARTDVKAFATRDLKRDALDSRAPIVVAARQTALERGGMALDGELRARERRLVYAPLAIVAKLRIELGSTPSAGIVMLAHLRAVRGSLAGVACFGFSFTDQIGPGPTSAHYFEDARPDETHGWRAERALFDAWTAGG